MSRATNKGREHRRESNETAKAFFIPPGDTACTAQSAQCLPRAGVC